jgi:hypothetical protein
LISPSPDIPPTPLQTNQTGKYHLATLHLAILASTIILLLLYLIASGFGKPHKESLLALKLYSVGSAVLGAEVFVTFWIYHVTMGPHSRIPNAAAAYPPIPTALARTITLSYSFFTPNYSSTLVTIFQVFEAAMDVCGIMCLFATVLLTKWFVEEKRDQKKQTAVETKKKTN